MVAAHRGNAACVALLIQKEANMRDEMRTTALMYAAGQGNAECV